LFIDAILQKKEMTRADIKNISNAVAREEKLKSVLLLEDSAFEDETENSSKRKKSSKRKAEENEFADEEYTHQKTESKEQTYNLFKEGLAIEEIAQTRRMATSTIEGHLVHYVATGILSGDKFVEAKKAKLIITTAKKLNSYKLGEIKAALSDEFTYTEIKFAIAGHLAQLNG
jgi:uncharacterized protein YpbB